MKANKKKIIVIVSMVLLLVATGCLNYFLTASDNKEPKIEDAGSDNLQNVNEEVDFFASYREDRELTRAQKILYLEEIISSEVSTTEAVVSAEDTRLSVIGDMEKELVLEGLIKATGFEDCVVTFGTENLNIVVKAESLTDNQIMQILDIVADETNVSLDKVVVMPYV